MLTAAFRDLTHLRLTRAHSPPDARLQLDRVVQLVEDRCDIAASERVADSLHRCCVAHCALPTETERFSVPTGERNVVQVPVDRSLVG